jgi:hypothetical protein
MPVSRGRIHRSASPRIDEPRTHPGLLAVIEITFFRAATLHYRNECRF